MDPVCQLSKQLEDRYPKRSPCIPEEVFKSILPLLKHMDFHLLRTEGLRILLRKLVTSNSQNLLLPDSYQGFNYQKLKKKYVQLSDIIHSR